MAWIMSDQTLGLHFKTKRLARFLGIDTVTAVGHLHYFWWWAYSYAPNGNISNYDSDDIAEAAEWTGSTQGFIDALVEAGFVDKDTSTGVLSIHDWDKYSGKVYLDHEKSKARVQKHRAKKKAEKTAQPFMLSDDAEAAKAAMFSRLSPEDAKALQKHTGITPAGTQ